MISPHNSSPNALASGLVMVRVSSLPPHRHRNIHLRGQYAQGRYRNSIIHFSTSIRDGSRNCRVTGSSAMPDLDCSFHSHHGKGGGLRHYVYSRGIFHLIKHAFCLTRITGRARLENSLESGQNPTAHYPLRRLFGYN